jgi:hypothetical protein
MLERAQVVGIKRQTDLAKAVGCTPERVTRWGQMPKPPRRMRKGFDEALARALQTTKQNLFADYFRVLPQNAGARWVMNPTPPWRQPDWDKLSAREQMVLLTEHVPDPPLRLAIDLLIWVAGLHYDFQDARREAHILRRPEFYKRSDLPPLPPEFAKLLDEAESRKKRKPPP